MTSIIIAVVIFTLMMIYYIYLLRKEFPDDE